MLGIHFLKLRSILLSSPLQYAIYWQRYLDHRLPIRWQIQLKLKNHLVIHRKYPVTKLVKISRIIKVGVVIKLILTLLTPPQDFDYFCVNFHANKGCKTQ